MQLFLEVLDDVLGVDVVAAAFECLQGGAAKAFEDEAVGDGVGGTADDGADAGEGFADVAGEREDDGELGFDFAACGFDEGLQVDVARGDVVEAGEVFQHVHAEVALDEDVGTRADGSDTAEHGFARVVFDEGFAAFAAVVAEAMVEVFMGEAQERFAVARGEGAARGGHLRDGLQEWRDVAAPVFFFPGRAAVGGDALDFLAVGAGAGDVVDAVGQAALDAGFEFGEFVCGVEVGFVEDDKHGFVEGMQAQDGDDVALGEVLVDDVGDDVHAARGGHDFAIQGAVCPRLMGTGHVEQGQAEAPVVFVVVALDGGGGAANDGGIDAGVRQQGLDERAFTGADFAEEGEFEFLRLGFDGGEFGFDGGDVHPLGAGGGGARLQFFEGVAFFFGGGCAALPAPLAANGPDFPDEAEADGGDEGNDGEVDGDEGGRGVLDAVPHAEGDIGELEDDEEDDQDDEDGQQDDGFADEGNAVVIGHGGSRGGGAARPQRRAAGR